MLIASLYIFFQARNEAMKAASYQPRKTLQYPQVEKWTFNIGVEKEAKEKNKKETIYLPELNGPESVSPKTDDAVSKAFESLNSGDYRQAAEIFGEISKTDKRAFLPLGFSYFKLGIYDKAIEALEESIKLKDEFLARKLLAFLYYGNNDLERGLKNAEHGLSLKEDEELGSLRDKIRREMKADGSFIKEGTRHFTVVFDGYSHGTMSRDALAIVEDAYNSIGRDMNYYPKEKITVILYTEKDFFDITKKPLNTLGLYDGKIRLPVRGADVDEGLLRRVLFHEYMHALIYSIAKHRVPLWVNEGLAEYFSGASPREVQKGIPLSSLESTFSGYNAAEAYNQSLIAVKSLIDGYGLYAMKKFLFSLGEGQDINLAFKNSFYIGYDDFLGQWGRG
jgi:tetratricopeptide (TPR) repeat protein